jgi:hypothetical protein
MLPTSTLPVAPLVGSSAMGLLIGGLAVGGLLALLIGYALHHREQRRTPRLDVADGAGAETPRRLSA